MALDLSGFVTPEQKFEGLYKLGEQLAEKRKEDAAIKLAQQKLTLEKDKAKSEDVKGFLSDLQKMVDPKDYYSKRVIGGLGKAYSELSKAAIDGANTNTLRMVAVPLVNDIVKEAEVTKFINTNLDKDLSNFDKNSYNIPKLKETVLNTIFKNPDGTDKNIEEVDYNPNVFNDIIKNQGYDIVNSEAILKGIKEAPDVTASVEKTYKDPSGKQVSSAFETKMKPWEMYDKNTNQIVPKSMIAMDNNQPIMHEGQPINVVPDDVYTDFIRKNRANKDFLDSQANLHLDEYSKQQMRTAGVPPDSSKIDINSPQAELIKKSILYDVLYQNRTGGVKTKQETKYPTPTKEGSNYGGYGTKSEADDAYDRDALHSTLDKQAPTNNYYDVSEYVIPYKYGSKRFAKNGLMYNPSTKTFKLNLVDADGNALPPKELGFKEVYSQIKTSNPKDDMNFFKHFGTFVPSEGKNSEEPIPPTPSSTVGKFKAATGKALKKVGEYLVPKTGKVKGSGESFQ
jgi:hypothetical protein